MHASQLSAFLALASISLASPVTTSCPYYSELAQFTSEGVSSCATILCSNLIQSTSTSTVTGVPTSTVYTTVTASPASGVSTHTDAVSTITSTLSVPVTEVSFVYTSSSSSSLSLPIPVKHRRQATATQKIGSCPAITSPAAADASAASAACSCFLTSVPTITQTVTQPPPGQCGPGTVTTTSTVTYTPATVYTDDVTSTVYTNEGPTSYVTSECTVPSAIPNIPYCTGETQSFGLMVADCIAGGDAQFQIVPGSEEGSFFNLENFPIQQASQFRSVYYTTPSINSPTRQELAEWFVNSTNTEVTQEGPLTTGDNADLISQAGYPPASAGDFPGYQCEVNSTVVHPWNCYYDNKPVNWFVDAANRYLFSGYGGLADTSGNYSQVALWYVPTCQIAPPTTNE